MYAAITNPNILAWIGVGVFIVGIVGLIVYSARRTSEERQDDQTDQLE